MNHARPSLYRILGFSLTVTTLALFFKLILNDLANFSVSEVSPFLLFSLAILVSSLYGDYRSGIFSTLLATAYSIFFFIEPIGFDLQSIQFDDRVRILLFVLEGCSISIISSFMHRHYLSLVEQALTETKQANTDKEDFIASVTHDLRGPLSVISSSAQLLKLRPDMPLILETSGLIEQNVHKLQRMINDLLDQARLNRGILSLNLQPTPLHQPLREAIRLVENEATQKHITLTYSPSVALPEIKGDPGRLEQAFWNIISNAIKFTPSGGTVTIAHHIEPQQVVITISDTGPGIDPEFLPHIFEPYKQGQGAEARRGLGLGLPITKRIIELHRGTITAAPAVPSPGTQFRISLPRS